MRKILNITFLILLSASSAASDIPVYQLTYHEEQSVMQEGNNSLNNALEEKYKNSIFSKYKLKPTLTNGYRGWSKKSKTGNIIFANVIIYNSNKEDSKIICNNIVNSIYNFVSEEFKNNENQPFYSKYFQYEGNKILSPKTILHINGVKVDNVFLSKLTIKSFVLWYEKGKKSKNHMKRCKRDY